MGYLAIKPEMGHGTVSFWQRNLPTWPFSKFEWLYNKNPAGVADYWTVVDDRSDSIIGVTAVFPRKIYAFGNRYMAGIAGDYAVDQSHRVLGPALQLQKSLFRYCSAHRYDVVYGFPNERSEAVMRRVGYELLGPHVRLVKVLNAEPQIKKYCNNKFFTPLLTRIANIALSLVAPERRIKANANLCSDVVTEIDDRFDELWHRAKDSYAIAGERTAEFLRWRVLDCPYRDYSIFTLTQQQDNRLVGYVVYRQGDRNVDISDIFADNLNTIKEKILPEFIKHIKQQHVVDRISVSMCAHESVIKIFKKYHFVARNSARNVIYFSGKATLLDDLKNQPDPWFLMELDND